MSYVSLVWRINRVDFWYIIFSKHKTNIKSPLAVLLPTSSDLEEAFQASVTYKPFSTNTVSISTGQQNMWRSNNSIMVAFLVLGSPLRNMLQVILIFQPPSTFAGANTTGWAAVCWGVLRFTSMSFMHSCWGTRPEPTPRWLQGPGQSECFWLLLQYTTLYSSKPGIQRLSISKHCAFLKRLARKNSLAWKREAFEIEAQYQSFR